MRVIALFGIALGVAGCAAPTDHSTAMSAAPRPQAAAPAPAPPAPPRVLPTTFPAAPPVRASAAPPPPSTLPSADVSGAPATQPVASRQYLLQTSGNWWLRVDRDGGGAYGYGGSPEDRATFGAGTFDFITLGRTLREKVTPDVSLPDVTAVTFTSMRGDPTDGILPDNRLVRSLFDRAKAHRQGDLARLNQLESSFPILPDLTGGN